MVEVLEAVDRLRQAAGDPSLSMRMLRVGTVNAGTSAVLVPAMHAFRAGNPGTLVEMVNTRPQEIHEGLVEGGLDLGLVNVLPGDDVPPDLQSVELLHGRPVVCCRTDHPFARAGGGRARPARRRAVRRDALGLPHAPVRAPALRRLAAGDQLLHRRRGDGQADGRRRAGGDDPPRLQHRRGPDGPRRSPDPPADRRRRDHGHPAACCTAGSPSCRRRCGPCARRCSTAPGRTPRQPPSDAAMMEAPPERSLRARRPVRPDRRPDRRRQHLTDARVRPARGDREVRHADGEARVRRLDHPEPVRMEARAAPARDPARSSSSRTRPARTPPTPR